MLPPSTTLKPAGTPSLAEWASTFQCAVPIPFVISGTSNIVDLDTNGTIVVFADTGKMQIAEVDIPGGSPQVLAGNGQVTNPDHVAISPTGGSVYWTESSGNYGRRRRGRSARGPCKGTRAAPPR